MEHIGRIKVIKLNKEDEYKSICICPHCGREAEYGEMMMISGTHCCPKCHDELFGTIQYLREHHYEAYTRIGNNHEDEPYKWTLEEEILTILKREMFNEHQSFDLECGWYDDSFSFSKTEQSELKEWMKK